MQKILESKVPSVYLYTRGEDKNKLKKKIKKSLFEKKQAKIEVPNTCGALYGAKDKNTRDLEILFRRRMTEIFQESSQLTARCAKFVRYDSKAKGAGVASFVPTWR